MFKDLLYKNINYIYIHIMSGALFQLQAIGQEDMYLTSNPEITFFKTTYKKYTNFAIDTMINPVSGNLGFGNDIICELPRNGDLISKIFLKIELSATTNTTNGKWGWIKHIGHNIIDKVTLQIGNRKIDSIDNNWLNIWHDLTKKDSQEEGYNNLIGNTEFATKIEYATGTSLDRKIKLFIPLHFYFTKKYNLALPILSLIYSKVNLIINIKNKNLLYNKSSHSNFTVVPQINNMTILTDYINLDRIEKNYFSSSPLEYLVEQVYSHYQEINNNEMNIILPFKHSVKALFWQILSNKYTTNQVYLSNDAEISTKKFILSFFKNDNNFNLGSTFTIINNTNNDIFDIETHIKSDYRNYTNKNNKTLKEIINSAYVNKSNITHDIITLDDITVPELLPIEIISEPINILLNNLFTNVNIQNNTDTVSRYRSDYYSTSESVEEYDIIYNDFTNTGIYIDGTENPILTNLITLDGNNRFQELPGKYFNYLQPYQYFLSSPKDGLNCFSFAIHPCEYQPSGVCNFSKIQTVNLKFKLDPKYKDFNKSKIYIYALSYNNCKISQGNYNLIYT